MDHAPPGLDTAPDSGQIKANVIVQHFPALKVELTEFIEEPRKCKRLEPESNDNKFKLMKKLTKVRQNMLHCTKYHIFIYMRQNQNQ